MTTKAQGRGSAVRGARPRSGNTGRVMLDAALDYAGQGWPVFPCYWPQTDGSCSCPKPSCDSVGKHPLTPNGFKDASRDEATIRSWWTRWPQANIGLPTGLASGVVVLDLDGSPVVCAMMLAAKLGTPPPPTRSSNTGGGGLHYFFRTPGSPVPNRTRLLAASGNGNGQKPSGIDVRGDGGFVVLPPSLHASGTRYTWLEDPRSPTIVPLPDRLLDLMRTGHVAPQGQQPTAQAGWVVEALRGVEKGQRNDTAARLAGHFLDRLRFNEPEVLAILAGFASKCRPPLDPDELELVIASVARRERAKGTGTAAEEPTVEGAEAQPDRRSEPVELLLIEPDEPLEWAVADLWPADANGIIGGEPKLLKTWLGQAIAWSLATGRPFADHFAIPKVRTVLFIEEEDPRRRTKDRLKALRQGIGGDPGGRLHIATKVGVKLDSEEGKAWLLEEIRRVKAEVVFLDTLRRVHSRDENNQKDMATVLSAMEAIRRETGAIVICIHHFKKAGGIGTSKRGGQNLSGTTDLHAWVDAALYVYPTKHHTQVRVVPESKDTTTEPFLVELEGLTGQAVRFVFKGTPEPDRAADMKARIVEAIEHLEAAEEIPTQKRIAEVIGVTSTTAGTYLEQLRGEGQVMKERARLDGTTQNVWRATHATQND